MFSYLMGRRLFLAVGLACLLVRPGPLTRGRWVAIPPWSQAGWVLLVTDDGGVQSLALSPFESGNYQEQAGRVIIRGPETWTNGVPWADTLDIAIHGDTMLAVPLHPVTCSTPVMPCSRRGGRRSTNDRPRIYVRVHPGPAGTNSVGGSWRESNTMPHAYVTFRSDGRFVMEAGPTTSMVRGDTLFGQLFGTPDTAFRFCCTLRQAPDTLWMRSTDGAEHPFVRRPFGCFVTPEDASAQECR